MQLDGLASSDDAAGDREGGGQYLELVAAARACKRQGGGGEREREREKEKE